MFRLFKADAQGTLARSMRRVALLVRKMALSRWRRAVTCEQKQSIAAEPYSG